MTRKFLALFLVLVAAPGALVQMVQAPNQEQQLPFRNVRAPSNVAAGRVAPARRVHEAFSPPITAAKIRTAIDDAVLFLRSRQLPDGSIPDGYGYQEGATALAALTLLAAGADPASDPSLKRALDWLAKQDTNNTYVRGIRANVWEYALRKAPSDERLRLLLKTDFDWLLAALGNKEGWRYTRESTDWDNSCTQYGVLGIWAAARAGFDPGDKFWVLMSSHFRGCQNPDGGWSYVGKGGSTANMATAGLASMFLVFDMYHGKSPFSRANPRTFTTGDAAEVLKAIDRGMDWLGQDRGNKEDGYYLYGIERTGVASGRKLIGGEDWFARGAQAVLQRQGRDGSIYLGSWGGPVVSTSFCTLFLVYGGAPVALNKLQFGKGQDWNLNPRDLANLSKALWSAYERPMNWQIVSIDSPASQIEAPILFLSGSARWEFTENEMLKLREYVERGGTILAEPSDRSPDFARSMEDLLNNLYPPDSYPDRRLAPLPGDHGIYTVVKQDWKNRPRLRGASNGARTFFLLSDEYLSGDWQADRTDSDAFKLALNLLFYATDLGELEGKFATILPTTPPAKKREGVLKVARVRHAGTRDHPQDWEAAGRGWQRLAPLAQHLTGRSLSEVPPIVLGKEDLAEVRLLHLTGRTDLRLSDSQRAALKKYVQSGGTLLVDAYAGSSAFAQSARKELTTLFGPLQPLAVDPILAEGRFEGGVDLSASIGFTLSARRHLRSRGEKPEGQKIQVVLVNRRPAVIFSDFDLVASGASIANYRALGYKPDSARKILGNLLIYLTLE